MRRAIVDMLGCRGANRSAPQPDFVEASRQSGRPICSMVAGWHVGVPSNGGRLGQCYKCPPRSDFVADVLGRAGSSDFVAMRRANTHILPLGDAWGSWEWPNDRASDTLKPTAALAGKGIHDRHHVGTHLQGAAVTMIPVSNGA